MSRLPQYGTTSNTARGRLENAVEMKYRPGAFRLVLKDGTNIIFFRGEVAHVFVEGEVLSPRANDAACHHCAPRMAPQPLWEHGDPEATIRHRSSGGPGSSRTSPDQAERVVVVGASSCNDA